MKLRTIVVYLILIIGLISTVATPVLANGGGDLDQTLSYNPWVLGFVGTAILVVAYFMYRILRGR